MSSYSDPSSSGQSLNAVAFIQQPRVILRLLGILFAIVVFACIADKVDGRRCYYDGDENACRYGIAIGVIAFIACVAFLVVDLLYDGRADGRVRKYMVMTDFIFSVIWSIMWFVGFCYLTDRWRKTYKFNRSHHVVNNAQAAIAFSFFSVVIWVALTVLAFLRYRRDSRDSSSEGYSSLSSESAPSETYRQPLFTGEKSQAPQYQPPTY